MTIKFFIKNKTVKACYLQLIKDYNSKDVV
jgi:hypothetical protein